MKAFKVPEGTLRRLSEARARYEAAMARLECERGAAEAALELPSPIVSVDFDLGVVYCQVEDEA